MTMSRKTGKRLFTAVSGTVLVGSLVVAGLTARATEWHPLPLVVLLGVLMLMGQQFHVTIRAQHLSGAFIALVLSCALLGPAPAVALSVATIVLVSASRRLALTYWLGNLSIYSLCPLAAGWIVRALIGDVHAAGNAQVVQSFDFALLVFGIFMTTTALNFALIATGGKLILGRTVADQIRELLLPLLPAQLTLGGLAAVVALAYTNLGYAVWPVAIGLLAMFQYLTTRLVRSEQRLEQLRQEAMQLASLQIGVLSFNLHGLESRQPHSGRHAAAVARYAEELARELGCSEEEQRQAHGAGLLHDIGKVLLADRLLQASEIVEIEDADEIRRHPIDGAGLLRHFPHYQAIAEIILAHHERWDGSGYPEGLIGTETPLIARIVGVCEAFDAMTAPDGPGRPRSADEAFDELREGAGRQFDPEIVELFTSLHEGKTSVMLMANADLDTELDAERRALMEYVHTQQRRRHTTVLPHPLASLSKPRQTTQHLTSPAVALAMRALRLLRS
jgi:putative nucleotidyltransferase with HDIG domain